ncbi:MAG: type IV conjugative transfer system protein TraL [Salinisphaera sp.]|nr:type IV conjugative transfer system protein TraL [Salinisphaera sp.]
MSEELKLPRTIDDPPQILLWSSDELVPIILGILIGVMTGHFLILFLLGLLVWRLIRRFKDSRPEGYMLHLLYWIGIPIGKARLLPNPYRRYWHG